jgi:hypothetical protein
VLKLFSISFRERGPSLDDGWEVRLLPRGTIDAFFRRHAIHHVVFWHVDRDVAIFSPSALWDHTWLTVDGCGERRHRGYAELRRWLEMRHGLSGPSASRARAIVRWFSANTTTSAAAGIA